MKVDYYSLAMYFYNDHERAYTSSEQTAIRRFATWLMYGDRPTKVAVGRRVHSAKKAKSNRKAGSVSTVGSPRRR